MTALAGFVLAGGASRRMGRDKALLPWGDATLLDHAIARLRRVCPAVHVLSGAVARYESHGVPVAPDVLTGRGPLGGVFTGLTLLGDGVGLFLAPDQPFATVELLDHLRGLAGSAPAVVPVLDGRPQPLCAAYSTACRPAIGRRLAAGDLKMTSFWPEVAVRCVEEAELARFGDPHALLRNLNTPEDYARLPPSTRRG